MLYVFVIFGTKIALVLLYLRTLPDRSTSHKVSLGMLALLGVACGRDRVFLNFGDREVAVPDAGRDRLSGAVIEAVPAWGVVWLEGGA